MSKLTAVYSIGSYWSPWFPFLLASSYFIDEIIVYNGGYDLKHPNKDEYNVPLEQVSKDISELDSCGKILEITDFRLEDEKRHNFQLLTQKTAENDTSGHWFNVNGLATTLGVQKACERGANWILRADPDQVLYENCRRLKHDLADKDLAAWQYEFKQDIHHLTKPPPDSPYNDTVFTHTAEPDDYYGGAGSPHIHSTRYGCDQINCGHFRMANPDGLTDAEKLKHFTDRMLMRLFFNQYADFTPELFERAEHDGRAALEDWVNLRESDVQPPEVTLLPRKDLREYAHAHSS